MNGLNSTDGMAAKKGNNTPLEEATSLIEKEMCILRETVTALENRLTSLLIEPQPQCGQGKDTVRPAKSPLLIFMDDTETAIRTQRCRLDNLLARLQV